MVRTNQSGGADMSVRIEVSPQRRDHVPGVTPLRPRPETDGRRATVEIGERRKGS